MTLICKMCQKMVTVDKTADSAECPRCQAIVLLPAGKWYAASELREDDIAEARFRERVGRAKELYRACLAMHDLVVAGPSLVRELDLDASPRSQDFLAGVETVLQMMRKSVAWEKLVKAVNVFKALPAPTWFLELQVPVDYLHGLQMAESFAADLEKQQKLDVAGYLELDRDLYRMRMFSISRSDAEKRAREIWAQLQRQDVLDIRNRAKLVLGHLVEGETLSWDVKSQRFRQEKA